MYNYKNVCTQHIVWYVVSSVCMCVCVCRRLYKYVCGILPHSIYIFHSFPCCPNSYCPYLLPSPPFLLPPLFHHPFPLQHRTNQWYINKAISRNDSIIFFITFMYLLYSIEYIRAHMLCTVYSVCLYLKRHTHNKTRTEIYKQQLK